MATLIDNNLTIFIFTCDAYSDLWDCTLSLFNENFPDISKDNLFLITDKKPDSKYGNYYKNFHIVWDEKIPNSDYVSKLEFALQYCSTNYFLFLLEDYFLTDKIDKNAIEDFVTFALNNDANYLKLNFKARNRLDSKIAKTKYGEYYSLRTYKPYAVDLYPSIWKKDYAAETCKKWPFKEKTIWDYEGKFYKLDKLVPFDKCFINIKNTFPFVDGVRKGKVIRKANKILKKRYRFNLTDKRKLMSVREYYMDKIIAFISRHLPQGLKQKIKTRNIKKGKTYYS